MTVKKIIDDVYYLGKYKLYPICRSITGQGVRDTLGLIKKYIPRLKIYSIKSGSKVFDWKIPPEWNIKEAYVEDKYGKRIIDFKNHNLHVVGYSIAINKTINRDQLINRLNSIPSLPNAIPYVISYYNRTWGFCCTDLQKKKIKKRYLNSDKFKVVIDSSLNKKGVLNYGEYIIPGKSNEEIFISCYICHPSMANNELSGPMVATALAKYFDKLNNKKTIRIVFGTETIGAIAYINKNLKKLKNNVIGGYILTCIGDDRNYSYLFSKYANSPSDYAAVQAFKKLNIKFKKFSFLKRGSDERQYNSPGVDLNLGSITRTKHSEFKEYHTSLDDFNLVTKTGIMGGFNVVKKAIEILDKEEFPKSKVVCEPQMGKRNLYPKISGQCSIGKAHKISKQYMDFLQFSDGKNSLKDIVNLTKISYPKVINIFKILKKFKLI